MQVVAGPSSRRLAEKVAELTGSDLIKVFSKTFPDGEVYIRLLSKPISPPYIVIQSMSPPQDSSLMQLLQIISAIRFESMGKIVAVSPYMAYARQDKRFLEGEPISAHIVGKVIESLGADAFLTIEVHSDSALKGFQIPALSIEPESLIAEYISEELSGNPFLLAPDEGALSRVSRLATILGCKYGHLKKSRDRYTGEIHVESPSYDFEGQDVVIYDDIISTGGTMALASKFAKKAGASKVYTLCIHGLFVGNSINKLTEAGISEIISTDTVESIYSKISMAPLIAEEITKFV